MRKSPMPKQSHAPEESPKRGGGERSEPTPREGLSSGAPPPTQVVVIPRRRSFPAELKLRILEEIDACRAPGEIGAVLRREGLYSSHLTKWREQRKKGVLAALSDVHRGPRPKPADARELEKLRKENLRLNKRLRQVELLLELQKKVSEVLGIPLNSLPSDELDS